VQSDSASGTVSKNTNRVDKKATVEKFLAIRKIKPDKVTAIYRLPANFRRIDDSGNYIQFIGHKQRPLGKWASPEDLQRAGLEYQDISFYFSDGKKKTSLNSVKEITVKCTPPNPNPYAGGIRFNPEGASTPNLQEAIKQATESIAFNFQNGLADVLSDGPKGKLMFDLQHTEALAFRNVAKYYPLGPEFMIRQNFPLMFTNDVDGNIRAESGGELINTEKFKKAFDRDPAHFKKLFGNKNTAETILQEMEKPEMEFSTSASATMFGYGKRNGAIYKTKHSLKRFFKFLSVKKAILPWAQRNERGIFHHAFFHAWKGDETNNLVREYEDTRAARTQKTIEQYKDRIQGDPTDPSNVNILRTLAAHDVLQKLFPGIERALNESQSQGSQSRKPEGRQSAAQAATNIADIIQTHEAPESSISSVAPKPLQEADTPLRQAGTPVPESGQSPGGLSRNFVDVVRRAARKPKAKIMGVIRGRN
jgi:hypothetical protein